MNRPVHPGGRIRALRQRQGRTLREVAAACGFTPSLLSKIETGATNPPVATLTAIARALGVGVAALLEDGGGAPVHAVLDAAADRRPERAVATDKGYRFFALAQARAGGLRPYVFTAERGQVRPEPLAHPGEETVLVLDGELRFRVGPTAYRLGPGDVLTFDAAVAHDMEPLSERATWFAVFAEPPVG
jgi:transcriptional regulator with XRE-family HTH domain